jgi:hypothetical protein
LLDKLRKQRYIIRISLNTEIYRLRMGAGEPGDGTGARALGRSPGKEAGGPDRGVGPGEEPGRRDMSKKSREIASKVVDVVGLLLGLLLGLLAVLAKLLLYFAVGWLVLAIAKVLPAIL